jgi:DNA recombination protein RmuC
MTDTLLIVALALLAGNLVLQVLLLRRKLSVDLSPVEKSFQRTEQAVRDEIARNREEASHAARQSREELANTLKGVADTLGQQLLSLTQTNDQKLAAMRETIEQRLGHIQDDGGRKLDQIRLESAAAAQKAREEVTLSLGSFRDSLARTLGDMDGNQRRQLAAVVEQLGKLIETNQQKLDALRTAVEEKLKSIQEDNAKQLDQMRATVDEKLQGTLEKRLGESFKQVSERLEQVYKGLGEMQVLATGVGDLKKVLTNVKTRGTFGEVQLGALLEQVLTPDQYGTNVATRDEAERVEFAIKLPGRSDDKDQVVWLPIDAKFPTEDYQRLVEAQEKADPEAAEAAIKALELRVKGCARDICDKYISPPKTTDFGILYLPTEGLFAEVVRRIGLTEHIQRECHVMIAGPTTLMAILNSLQMGFRTLAIQKRSSEVWNLLAAVKTEFGKYGDVLNKVQKKLQEATNTIDTAAVRTRAIERKLKDVQELPATDAQAVLLLQGEESEIEDAGQGGGAGGL